MLEKILICTDLDRTLLPNGSQPESSGAREYFARLAAHPEETLAYVSGRHKEIVKDAIRDDRLPLPDWVIGDVGTTIYQINDNEWRHWLKWEEDISADWRGKKSSDLRALFDDLPTLRLQEEAKQNAYKLSFYVSLQTDINGLQQEMASRLKARNLAASLIYSVDEAACTGLLDVLPACATKLHAVEFLMRHQGFDLYNTIFAGDSGNDLPVLASGIHSILVANADKDVIKQARLLAKKQGNSKALYIAQGGYLGMNGNYSAGILEGIMHYYPDTAVWLKEKKTP